MDIQVIGLERQPRKDRRNSESLAIGQMSKRRGHAGQARKLVRLRAVNLYQGLLLTLMRGDTPLVSSSELLTSEGVLEGVRVMLGTTFSTSVYYKSK